MRAVIYKGRGQVQLEERTRPVIIDDTDTVVRVTCTAICSSDIHIKHGVVPRAVPGVVLGHEFVGVVEEVGTAVKKVRPGDRVAVNVETYCGNCFYCRRGFVNNCADKLGGWSIGCRIDGGQAEYVRVPYADNGLTKIPPDVTDEAALFAGDLLSTGYWASKLGEISESDTIVVIGAGPAGLCTMMCARLHNPAKIIGIDIDSKRLKVARENGLADITCNPLETGAEELERIVRRHSEGRGADAVIEMAGGKDTFRMAWQLARPNANVVLAAMYEEAQMLPLPDMYGKNLVFKTGGVDGIYCDEIMKMIAAGKLDASCIITHRTDLEHIMEAYEIFENKRDGVIKYAVHVN